MLLVHFEKVLWPNSGYSDSVWEVISLLDGNDREAVGSGMARRFYLDRNERR